MNRDALWARIKQQPDIPVLIVGGGINGVGLLRELALQGVDALLVEKRDFCAGASAASSRMIHGGLRYLENGEFRLVRESLRERNLLLQNAPHYVKPLPTTIPIFHLWAGVMTAMQKFLGLQVSPANRGALLIKVGLSLYDLLTRQQRLMPTHSFQSRRAALASRPQLNPAVVCTATYYDAWIPYPERLGLELVLDAEALHPGALALNYVALQAGAGNQVTLRDEATGAQLDITPRVVVNATGAWIDFVNHTLQHQTQFIGGTKGSHLVIDNPALLAAVGDEMLYYENADGRICIMFALLGKVLVGSTDIKVQNPEDARCDEDEITYILESVRQVFPALEVSREDVVFHFCGVRPLPHADTLTTGQISRDHSCRVIAPDASHNFPIYSLIGGKWTTFRAFAEQVADNLLDYLGQPRRARSDSLPIGGGKDYPHTEAARQDWLKQLSATYTLSHQRAEALLLRYGTRARQVAAFISAAPDSPLKHHPAYTRREIEFILQHERLVHLDDLVRRRTTLAFQGELTPALLDELAAICAPLRQWSAAQTQQEINRTAQILLDNHGVDLTAERVSHHARFP